MPHDGIQIISSNHHNSDLRSPCKMPCRVRAFRVQRNLLQICSHVFAYLVFVLARAMIAGSCRCGLSCSSAGDPHLRLGNPASILIPSQRMLSRWDAISTADDHYLPRHCRFIFVGITSKVNLSALTVSLALDIGFDPSSGLSNVLLSSGARKKLLINDGRMTSSWLTATRH